MDHMDLYISVEMKLTIFKPASSSHQATQDMSGFKFQYQTIRIEILLMVQKSGEKTTWDV